MHKPVLERKGFSAAVLDALTSQICVVNALGEIIAVNRAWTEFAKQNPPVPPQSGVGAHYLDVCNGAIGPDSDEAKDFAEGLMAVLRGESENFELEYPCHSPTEERWFIGRVTPLGGNLGGAVISHLNITARKLLEFKLARLAATDELTGLPNRRFFDELIKAELRRVKRFGKPASVVMIDLDHFKRVNDTLGHPAGDEALRTFARTCQEQIRSIDVIARFGGEEFILLLPETGAEQASIVAEKLRQAVEQTPVESGGKRFSITSSFGVAEMTPDDRGIGDIVERADQALNAAKRAGRNRVVRFDAMPKPVQLSHGRNKAS